MKIDIVHERDRTIINIRLGFTARVSSEKKHDDRQLKT